MQKFKEPEAEVELELSIVRSLKVAEFDRSHASCASSWKSSLSFIVIMAMLCFVSEIM